MKVPKEHSCPYCHASATLGAVYYDQNCAGCVKRMSAQQPVSMEPEGAVIEGYESERIIHWRDGFMPSVGTKLYTQSQLAAARKQGAEEERKKWEINLQRRERIDTLEAALKEWLDKTEWVQQGAAAKELGMHRADVLKRRIAELEKSNAVLLGVLKQIQRMGYSDVGDRIMVDDAIAAAEVKP